MAIDGLETRFSIFHIHSFPRTTILHSPLGNVRSVGIRVGPDIRWPDIDFCRISGYPVSGFLRTGYPAGYPVSGKSTGYPVSGHFAGLSGRIFDYFEQKFKTYPFRQLSFCPFIFYLTKMALEYNNIS